MEEFYVLDLERCKAEGGGKILGGMRAAVGRAKRRSGGETRLTGIALDRQGGRLTFCFRLAGKTSDEQEER